MARNGVELIFQLFPPTTIKAKHTMLGGLVVYVLWLPYNDKVNDGEILHLFNGNHRVLFYWRRLHLL
jgi:hypothetical protein